MVTSWNDWNEDTGIEPIGGTPTDADNSPSAGVYTGLHLRRRRTAALKVLRADVNLLDRRFATGRTGSAKGAIRRTRVDGPDNVVAEDGAVPGA